MCGSSKQLLRSEWPFSRIQSLSTSFFFSVLNCSFKLNFCLFGQKVSIFDLGVSCGVKGHTTVKQVTSKPFPQPLLETRSGDPDPATGIPPAVLTTKTSWTYEKPPKVRNSQMCHTRDPYNNHPNL